MSNFTLIAPLDFVQNVSRPWWLYIPMVFLIAFIPSAILSAGVNIMFQPESAVDHGDFSTGLVVSLVIVAPLLETLLMWPVIAAIQRVGCRQPFLIAAISALLWAGFHALQTPVWGLTVIWSFFIFSLCFVSWRRVSLLKAYGYTAAVHALQNFLAVGYILLRTS